MIFPKYLRNFLRDNIDKPEIVQVRNYISQHSYILVYTLGVCYNNFMKARTNVSIDKTLLESARSHKLILSSLLEEAIKKQLRIAEEKEWKRINSQNISSYNNFISKNGVFSDGMRLF